MRKLPKSLKPPKLPLAGLELDTIKDMWLRCRFIEVRLLRPQGVEKPISFKSDKEYREREENDTFIRRKNG